MTTTKPCFSNGTEFTSWLSINCKKCLKAVWYNEKTDSYPIHRCSIQRDIEAQVAGLCEISERSYKVAQMITCPYLISERKVHKKRKIKNQTKLEL